MNLIIIGAQASGKMTVGQEVERLTDLVLFHNHESIDFVTKFFPMSDEARELINDIRMKFFETSAKTDLGLIFTVVIDFNDPADISFLSLSRMAMVWVALRYPSTAHTSAATNHALPARRMARMA